MIDQVDQNSNYEVTYSDKPVTTDAIVLDEEPTQSGQEKNGSAQPSESSADSKDDAANAADDAGEKTPKDDEEKPQPTSRVQKRIDRLTREKYQLKRDLEELNEVKRELAELKARTRADGSKPADDAEPNIELYDTYDEYQAAMDKYEAAKKDDAAAKHDNKHAAKHDDNDQLQNAINEIQDGYDEARAKYSDFDDTVMQNDLAISKAMIMVIAETEDPTEVLYHLGKHKDDAERIASLTPTKIAMEIGKIERSLKSSGSKTQKAKTEKKPTGAPEPIDPISGSSAVKSKLSDARSQQEYASIRAEQAQNETRGAGWV